MNPIEEKKSESTTKSSSLFDSFITESKKLMVRVNGALIQFALESSDRGSEEDTTDFYKPPHVVVNPSKEEFGMRMLPPTSPGQFPKIICYFPKK